MFAKLIAYFLMALGVLFILKPDMMKKRLHKKAYKKARYYIFALALFLGSAFVKIGFAYHGIIPKIIMILGVIAIVKGLFLLKAKAYEHLMDFISSKPLWVFRLFALSYILTGLLILFGIK